ncbi:D-alanyl-D-alanine carboxypeptidase [Candidatus Hepatincola sp. Pdp]
MKISKIIVVLSCIFCVTKGYAFNLPDSDSNNTNVVIDYNSGQILVDKNKDQKMYPASLTKLMTLYILFEKIDKGEIKFTDKIKVSRAAARQEPTKLGLPAGSTIMVKDAIVAVIVKSANDMAYAIAEHVEHGNYKKFIKEMNTKAVQLGLANTHYVNANGLHNNNQYTTAYDMAKLARALMIHYNSYYSLFSVPSFSWKRRTYSSTDHLLEYHGVDGIKTGYTRKSGFNLVSSAQNDNTRIIAVVMGFRSHQSRDEYMKTLIDQSLILAYNNRKFSVPYAVKPTFLKNTNGESLAYVSHTKTPNQEISTINYDSNNLYAIEKVSQVIKLTNSDKVAISPYVKSSSRKHTYHHKAKYQVQVGAFSSYHSALSTAYNTLLIKGTNKLHLAKKNVLVNKKNSYYVARFGKLTKSQANQTCKVLHNKGKDCLVVMV